MRGNWECNSWNWPSRNENPAASNRFAPYPVDRPQAGAVPLDRLGGRVEFQVVAWSDGFQAADLVNDAEQAVAVAVAGMRFHAVAVLARPGTLGRKAPGLLSRGSFEAQLVEGDGDLHVVA